MEIAWDILKDALIDTAKVLPILLIVYFLIELLEYKNVFSFQRSKLLNGKASPVVGAVFGSLPQCGFSVISAELYAERKISIAALVAVFVATSDEALPIMISNYKSIPALLMLIAVKIVIAIAMGYAIWGLYKLIFKNSKNGVHLQEIDVKTEEHNDHEKHPHIHACCGHDTEQEKFDWKHPLVHTLKISAYILIFNILFNTLVKLVTEEAVVNFLSSSEIFQPVLAVVVGLIPNCVASVALTELYLIGGLSFGSIVAGLSVNAGIGFLILLRKNKNWKENLFIIISLILFSLIFGYALHFIPFGFLKI
ncbi:MAG: arsenic efflux protein [Clostridia bacterium]|nr:arsenic efflux protein [Clostridia bacterium]